MGPKTVNLFQSVPPKVPVDVDCGTLQTNGGLNGVFGMDGWMNGRTDGWMGWMGPGLVGEDVPVCLCAAGVTGS